MKMDEGRVTFTSKTLAPLPFSETNEPAATLTMEAAEIDSIKSIEKITQSEVEEIKKTLKIAEYAEDDHKPIDDIAVYYETYNSVKVGFIKYRSYGNLEKPANLPRTIIHAIFTMNNKIYYVHLITLYAEKQNLIRKDQIQLVKDIIAKSK
jgi:hypothetical protein